MAEQVRVSVIIPTMRRPDGLIRALESVLAQEEIDQGSVEIIVFDNDPAGSARDVVARYNNAAIQIIYGHEPTPGVATVRNSALRIARGRLIAWLDDDQCAVPLWLASFLAHYEAYKPVLTFGPTHTALPREGLPHAEYLEHFFARHGPSESGMYDEFYGCGHSFLDLDQIPAYEGDLFDVSTDHTGGEDDFLFSKLKDKGFKFGWVMGAVVHEHVPEHRATLGYTMKRTFAYGQAPTTICAKKSPPDIPGVVYWSLIGMAQTLVYGSVTGIMYCIQAKRRAFWLDKTVQALGKIFWFGPFEFRFYGTHAA